MPPLHDQHLSVLIANPPLRTHFEELGLFFYLVLLSVQDRQGKMATAGRKLGLTTEHP